MNRKAALATEHISVGGTGVRVCLVTLCRGLPKPWVHQGTIPTLEHLAVKHAVSTSLAWSLFSKVLNFMLDLALDQIPSAEAGFREKQGHMARTGYWR